MKRVTGVTSTPLKPLPALRKKFKKSLWEIKQHIHFDNICCSSYSLMKKGKLIKHTITDQHNYRIDR